MSEKQYLGDGVYADIENSMIKLTTWDGLRDTNTIFLELEVYSALNQYVQARIAARKKAQEDR